jgi:ectoine hydroxylase-related dioxygenase (phytanoyl-CoA dioxygenase family)
MLSDAQVAAYRRDGYIVVEDVLAADELAALRADVARLLEGARGLQVHDAVYDLEDSHRPDRPRVRRIKQPHQHAPAFATLARHPGMLAIAAKLIGPNIRLQSSKLNLKTAGHGAPVEWHQDWAFYPHTNDDILAVGVMLDDMTADNGPLLFLPGSHFGPVHSHHNTAGYFCGAIDPVQSGLDLDAAVPVTAPAGSMSFHHVRLVHGSALNGSGKDRQLVLYELLAADAWPLAGNAHPFSDLEAFNARIVLGEPTLEPRVTPVPVRVPLPRPGAYGSIYDAQGSADARYFETFTDQRTAEPEPVD